MSNDAVTSPWQDVSGKHILVVGLGKTGHSAARYLLQQGANVTLWDTRQLANSERAAEQAGYCYIYGPQAETFWSQFAGVVLSPGVDPQNTALSPLRTNNLPIIGDIELFAIAHNTRLHKPKLIGVTGSNGKTTCTLLITHLLKQAGLRGEAAGNVGLPALDIVTQPLDAIVLELSSFQLEMTSSLHLDAACYLNLSDDHMDRHHSMANYGAIKQRIFRHAKTAIYWREQQVTHPDSTPGAEQKHVTFGLTESADSHSWTCRDKQIFKADEAILPLDALPMAGLHNALNTMAALAACDSIAVDIEQVKSAVSSFTPPPHRCVTIANNNQVQWIDDSKATNPGATLAALTGIAPQVTGRLFLIAGGDGKGADLSVLKEAITKNVHQLVTIGRDGPALAKLVDNSVTADSLEAAVEVIAQQVEPNDVVLLSPACASWDMFTSYVHRAKVFADSVARLAA